MREIYCRHAANLDAVVVRPRTVPAGLLLWNGIGATLDSERRVAQCRCVQQLRYRGAGHNHHPRSWPHPTLRRTGEWHHANRPSFPGNVRSLDLNDSEPSQRAILTSPSRLRSNCPCSIGQALYGGLAVDMGVDIAGAGRDCRRSFSKPSWPTSDLTSSPISSRPSWLTPSFAPLLGQLI